MYRWNCAVGLRASTSPTVRVHLSATSTSTANVTTPFAQFLRTIDFDYDFYDDMASAGVRQCIRDVTLYLVLLIFVSTLGPLQFGYHLAELNAPQSVIRSSVRLSESEYAFLSSIFVVGGFLGALLAGPTSTRYGRLRSMRITSICFVLGSGLETTAGTVWVISIGRFFSGVGAGASTVIVPLYISEIAPPKERGLFGTMTQITINVGILITQTLGYYLSKPSLWRIILAVGFGIAVLQLVGLCFLPESPAWLASNVSQQEAIEVLQRIRGSDNSIDEEVSEWDGKLVPEEERLLHGVQCPLVNGREALPSVGFFGVIRDPFYRPAIIAVIGIMVAQQFCGVNSIMMYSVSLLEGLLPVSSTLVTIMVSFVNLFTTIACAPLADKIGRKSCLLLSIAGMGSMSLCLAFSMLFKVKLLSAISVTMFVAFFAMGLGPVPFMMASELVGQEAVGATQSWALGSNYVATFIVAQFFPLINTALNKNLGGSGWAYFIFAALALLSFLFVSLRVPETKGKKNADDVWGRARRDD